MKALKRLDAKTHKIIDYALVTSLFTIPKFFAFKGKHTFILHGIASVLTFVNSAKVDQGEAGKVSRLQAATQALAGLGLLILGLSKMRMQKRARLFYGISGLAFSALAVFADYKRPTERDTWTEAASKAQEDLDNGESVSQTNKDAMGDHAAA